MNKKNEIIYPFFLECCVYTKDYFWENLFEDLAYGISPSGTYIVKNSLCSKYKGKEFNYKIERKDPKIIYKELHDILVNKLGISSKKDKEISKMKFRKVEQDIKDSQQEWSKIRKKNIKELLIERYVLSLKKKHSFKIKQSKRLLSLIILSLIFKTITAKDIIYKNGKIENIKVIPIKDGDIVFSKTICDIGVANQQTSPKKPKKLKELWSKYITSF